jgi:hypothetical protein
MRTPSAVGDTGFVMAGGDVGAEPLLETLATPGATPGATARNHKGKTWSPEEQIAVMEAYAMVSGDQTTGASQCATEFAVRIERQFLANRQCPAKDESKNSSLSKISSFAGHRRFAISVRPAKVVQVWTTFPGCAH